MAPRVVVIGGGITGLVAALRLSGRGAEVTVVEAADRLGGKVQTSRVGNATIELGADAFLPRDEGPLRLCREIGVDQELVQPADFGAWIFHRGRLHRMPPGTVMGAPTSVASLATSSLLSWKGKARAALDLIARRRLTGDDVSVASVIRGRLGAEVLERMVDPLLAGTRAGHVSEMSLAAAVPALDQAARSKPSLIRGLRESTETSVLTPSFHAPREGMSRLIEALEAKLQSTEILKGQRAVRVVADRAGYTVEIAGSAPIGSDAVVLTTPSYVTADLLAEIAPEAAEDLRAIPHVSAAVVNLLFPPDTIGVPAGGSGVLVPSAERMTLAGCTWFSNKWPALAAPDGSATIRCFIGRGERDPALDLDDHDLVGVVLTELGCFVKLSGDPSASHVHRWDRALPQYKVGHLDRVARIEKLLARTTGLAVAGASFRGSGIPDCIAQAERAAAHVLKEPQG